MALEFERRPEERDMLYVASSRGKGNVAGKQGSRNSAVGVEVARVMEMRLA